MQKIRKAIIPVAGFGTRFLPATKAMPKEMLPVVDKPVIQYIVEAAVDAGIEEIIIVTSSNKRSVEDHFDVSFELEAWLTKTKKNEQLKKIRLIPRLANFIYIRQKGKPGNGTPVLNCRKLIGNEPFAVFYGDEFYIGENNWVKQMIEVYEKYHDPIVALTEVPKNEVSRYGIFSGPEVEKDVYQINEIIEKPNLNKAPSRLANIGGYILTPEIFPILSKLKPGKGGEIWLAEAVKKLSQKRSIYGKKIDGTLYDAGTIPGWLKANVEIALQHQGLKKEFATYLKKLKF